MGALDWYRGLEAFRESDRSLPQTHRFRGKSIFMTPEGRQFYESWVPPEISPRPDDRYVEVTTGTAGRLDLISHSFYGTPRFWWVIAVANDLFDPIADTTVGLLLRCPSPTRLYSEGLVRLL